MDGSPDSLAEVAMKQPRGPVAVIAASRISMPYANSVLSKEILDALFMEKARTVGEALALAKRRLLVPKEGDQGRAFIEMMAGLAYEADPRKRAAECREHAFLYNLFGDPATRIPRAADLALEAPEEARPGGRLKVTGGSPVAGEALVEIVAPRSPLVPGRTGDREEDFKECYERANAWTKASVRVPVRDGRFEADLAVPAGLAPGRYFVRAYVEGEGGAAMGSKDVKVVGP
jgi:hypothetical protein